MKSGKVLALFLLIFLIGCAPSREIVKPVSRPQLIVPEKMENLFITLPEEKKQENLPSPFPEKLVSFTLEDADIREVLLTLARKSDLNMVIDPGVAGKVNVDLKQVNLVEALDSILEPLGLEYEISGRLVRVSPPKMETRILTLDYVITEREGEGELTVSGGVAEAGSESGGSGSGSSGGGSSGGGSSEEESTTSIKTKSTTNLWQDIKNGLETIIFGSSESEEQEAGVSFSRGDESGRRLIGNPISGVIIITAYPEELALAASFLETVEGSVQREVIIQARIVEVTLRDDYQMGIDWNALADAGEFTGIVGEGWILGQSLNPGNEIFQIGVTGDNFAALLDVMASQGRLNVLSSPRICTLNNQKAVIKVGREEVFWEVTTERSEEYGWVVEGAESSTVTVGIVLDVTPQISRDGSLIMHIHPSVSEVVGESESRFGDTRPILDVREADTVVKVKDGQTIVIGGMMKDRKAEDITKIPLLGDIPFLGSLFRYTGQQVEKTELVVFLTPTVVIGDRMDNISREDEERMKRAKANFHLGAFPGKYGVRGEFPGNR